MGLTKSIKNDLKAIESNMPVCYFKSNDQLIKVNHKKRLINAYKKGKGDAVQKYANEVVNAFKFAVGQNNSNIDNKAVPILNA